MSADRVQAALEATADDLLRYLDRRVVVHDDAADLLGETMLQAWRRAGACPADAERQRMWLFTIAANVLANHRRGATRRHRLADRLRAEITADAVPDDTERHTVRDAVLRLHDAHRELVMLIHWDGMTVAQAAELLGLNASTARTRYAAARNALREALAEVGADSAG
ncbi:RNA polymerase sigma factor [Nocardioides sp. SR21]|uniref:RNA polymerase sigma factor n=1 Tax=Nocardioides sp. SR21 TaxID=2919501 RepID=UPI001FAA899D|nr:RNA polymerase sigma factor [Nocardioides sp. SR21]